MEKTKKTVKPKSTKVKTSSKSIKEKAKKSPKKQPKVVIKEPKNIKILGYNDLELNTYVYDNVENPKAVVIIIHGMQEHCLRYRNFAEYLNKNGYLVIASDLRGHGHTAIDKQHLGFGERNIFKETLQDQLNIIAYANEIYNLPIYIFGHSYGSMLSQVLIQMTPLVEKCVLCGTANGGSGIMKLGNTAVKCLAPFKNKNTRGGLVESMCIKSYGKKFKNGNWLTRDEKVFEDYQ